VAFSVPLGNNLFKEQIEATLVKSVYYTARGRPKQGKLSNATITNYPYVPPTPLITDGLPPPLRMWVRFLTLPQCRSSLKFSVRAVTAVFNSAQLFSNAFS
jgi:hypothetical protein